MGFFAFLFGSALGCGLAFWICATLLDKSNNIGDSHGSSKDYMATAIFTERMDRLSKEDRQSFSARYARDISDYSAQPSDNEQVRRLTDDELEYYKIKKAENLRNPNADMDKPIDDMESEFEKWEKQNMDQGSNTQPIFKPLDNNRF